MDMLVTHISAKKKKNKKQNWAQFQNTVIFLPIKPTRVSGIVPKAKKYVFFPN